MPKQTEITLPDEFASTMQQLVAEAAKTVGPLPGGGAGQAGGKSGDGAGQAFAALTERLVSLERTITIEMEKLRSDQPTVDANEVNAQLERLEAQMDALRSTEAVNQRLFNSLHEELKSYRDNFLRESLQKPFIRDLVVLLDDLTSISAQMANGASSSAPVAQWTANLENAIHALLEILHRMEVSEVEPKERVDRAFHRVVSYEPADFEEDDGRIVMRVKRGFVWRNQVLRLEEVVAKRFA